MRWTGSERATVRTSHADVVDALRLQTIRSTDFRSLSMSEMLDRLGVDAASVVGS